MWAKFVNNENERTVTHLDKKVTIDILALEVYDQALRGLYAIFF